ncbi:MAG: acyl-CoA/acyl-ACP dehydrogenase [Pelatocladus maniniholoensis HA4357-MV3]|jgi:alkylation response protein AidB-like acyl-CoA dehydrogenase|uniref:Acyl-CoA/acyl-ACP dehydrogenase n=1 Tax=Pelatocladus maniniholoensis HA4357-MV3 TaxID=1117104 RepID=A0A9E3LV89_9NOST|nr:acyl-CoA/acyl-ACP dehydrogenase [Pelatocladus maniniholoensis HA4357-MV3]
MCFLEQERKTLAKFLPGLDQTLAEIPLLEMEKPGNPAIKEFRKHGGTNILIPSQYGGLGASLVEAVQMQRAIASRSPSLAVATTMHHGTVLVLTDLASTESELKVIEDIAQRRLYVSSAFAEGQANAHMFAMTMKVTKTPGGYKLSGSKKPCSLTYSMDLITFGIMIPGSVEGEEELALAILPADTPGIERQKFWGNWVLSGAESDEVLFKDVFLPEESLYRAGDPRYINTIQAKGLLWFEVIMSAAYLGIASALVERVIMAQRGTPIERASLGIDLENSMAALEGLAYSIMLDKYSEEELLAKSLFIRFATQGAIERTTKAAVELLGGMSFISSPEVSCLFASAHALAFHPPSRFSISPALDHYLMGMGLN